MNKIRMILDCDPGHDDAVAIMMAANNPKIELLGITIVSGNQSLEKTVGNALHVLQWIGKSIKVYPGADRPLVREKVTAADIHGETGLDGPVFPPLDRTAEQEHAVSFIIRTLLATEDRITMVTTGPMTNLALALRMEPKISGKIERIVLMGGAYGNGNVTPAAEFNIITDAEAAHICFSSGIPITMIGLDVTRKVLCYPQIVKRMGQVETSASALFTALMSHFCKTQKEVFGWEGGPLHDPVTIAYLTDPTILTVKPANVRIDLRSSESYGRTNCDLFDYLKLPHNADVAVDIDVARFWNIIENGLKSY